MRIKVKTQRKKLNTQHNIAVQTSKVVRVIEILFLLYLHLYSGDSLKQEK